MKIVITSTGNSLKSDLDLHFGKSAWFCIYDTTSGNTQFIQNDLPEETHGACRKTASLILGHHPSRVISGHFGPNGTRILEENGIQMVIPGKTRATIEEIIHSIKINQP